MKRFYLSTKNIFAFLNRHTCSLCIRTLTHDFHFDQGQSVTTGKT